MKRFICAALAACMCLSLLAGCGATASSGTDEPKDYAHILQDARGPELNEVYDVFYLKEDGSLGVTAGNSGEYTDSQAQDIGSSSLTLLGIDPADCTGFAVSVSQMMTQSYGIAIVQPAEGKADAVKEGLQGFIQQQMDMQEHYLADQYDIAKAAKLEVAPSGEVVLVMCEGAGDVLANIQKALK